MSTWIKTSHRNGQNSLEREQNGGFLILRISIDNTDCLSVTVWKCHSIKCLDLWERGGPEICTQTQVTGPAPTELSGGSDTDPGPQDPVLWLQYTNTHGLQKSCGEKRMAWPLSEWERARGPEGPTSAWTGFYCFFGYITWRMVLIYYAQVHCRWLLFTYNKRKSVANYFKEKDVTDQGEKWLNWLYSTLGRFSSDFRKLRICGKHLLSQSRVRDF